MVRNGTHDASQCEHPIQFPQIRRKDILFDLKILCFAAEICDDIAKRNQSLIRGMSKHDTVSSVLYVNPPVLSIVSDLLRGRFASSHLGQNRALHWRAINGRMVHPVTEKIRIYTGSEKILPFSRF
jgi:hypothetical protein